MGVNRKARSGDIIGISFQFSLINMKLYFVFSLESSQRGNSNEYTQYTIFNIKKKITLSISNLQLCFFSKGLKNEFETAVVNEPSVFEPLKFYRIFTFKDYLKC